MCTIETLYTTVVDDVGCSVTPGDVPEVVGELPDVVVVGVVGELSWTAHSVMYCTETPCPSAATPVVSAPLPNPVHFWLEAVSAAL